MCGLAAFIVAAPLRIIYPWRQGDYDAKETLMRETRSSDGFKPSNPTYETYLLAQKGVPFSELWQDNHWIISSAASFYGLFGYFSIALPTGLYNFVLIVSTISLLITVGIAIIRRTFVPSLSKWLFAFSPLVFLINFASSMYHSWTFEYQPQGRYLYGSVVALSLLLSGTVEIEPKWLKLVRVTLFFLMTGLSVYILWTYMATIQ